MRDQETTEEATAVPATTQPSTKSPRAPSPLSRRRFLQHLGIAGAGASVAGLGLWIDPAVAAAIEDGASMGSSEQRLYADAYRFLSAATFGPISEEVNAVLARGRASWIEDQMDPARTPRTVAVEYMSALAVNDFQAMRGHQELKRPGTVITIGGPDPCPPSIASTQGCTYKPLTDNEEGYHNILRRNGTSCLYDIALHSNDQLRQRVAFVLSKIFIVSEAEPSVLGYSMAQYWDVLASHAFGDFESLLGQIVRSPAMGLFLTHRGNTKRGPDDNGVWRDPDENMARELLQLFTIGRVVLNQDGTTVEPPRRAYHPQDDVRALARVLTGLWDSVTAVGAPTKSFGQTVHGYPLWERHNLRQPMRFFDDEHDFDDKHFPALELALTFSTPPSGPFPGPTHVEQVQSADEELDRVLYHLVRHPNVAPFICKRLIQGLTTANPSPQYVSDVAAVFAANRNLGETVEAILLHPDFDNPPAPATFGRTKDPLERQLGFLRAVGFTNSYPLDGFPRDAQPLIPSAQFKTGAHRTLYGDSIAENLMTTVLMGAPSVFGYFPPAHVPPTSAFRNMAPTAQLVSPESAVLGGSRMARAFNKQYALIFATGPQVTSIEPFHPNAGPTKPEQPLTLSLSPFNTGSPQQIVGAIDQLLFGYGMSPAMRTRMVYHVSKIPDPDQQLRTALMAAMASPEYATQR